MLSRSGARSRLARRVSWLAVLSLTVAAFVAPAASPVLAASVPAIPINSGNPTCSDFDGQYGGGQTWLETKDESPGNGTLDVSGFGTITISNFEASAAGEPGSFDWSSTFGIDAVFVKAGSTKHNLYVYAATAGAAESTGDEELEAQEGQGNGISHISFCYDADQTPTPTPTPTPVVTPTPTPVDPTPTPVDPTPTPVDPTPTPSEETEGSILIAKVDNKGTADPSDDELLDGATFEVRLDDGDKVFEPAQDTLVFGPEDADGGMLDTDDLLAGWYWIVETSVPDGFVGSDPILVELNLDPSVTCFWDASGLLDCSPNEGDVEDLSWTIVIVDNTPDGSPTSDPTPTGAVGGATGTPGVPGASARATLPATDTLDGASTASTGDGLRIVFLAMAGLLAAALLLTPARVVVRKDDASR